MAEERKSARRGFADICSLLEKIWFSFEDSYVFTILDLIGLDVQNSQVFGLLILLRLTPTIYKSVHRPWHVFC